MPRDDILDPRTLTPGWYARETRLAHMLPYVSLVGDRTVRTRVNELFQWHCQVDLFLPSR